MAKQSMFIINDVDFMLKVWEKGRASGKKPGDSCQAEFEEMLAIDPGAVTFIGNTDQDIDMLTGEIRSNNPNVKVTNLKEIERQNENHKKLY